jgi:hypothetical protein
MKRFWPISRCVLYACSFAFAAAENPPGAPTLFPASEPFSISFVVISVVVFGGALVCIALGVCVCISLSSLNKGWRGTQHWVRPTHASNPFSFFGPPLAFFHYAGFSSIAAGLGFFSGAIFPGIFALLEGVLCIAFGGAILAGLHFGMACCKNYDFTK